MSGVKGKSGGARKNAGGARPGAGRKPNPVVTIPAEDLQVDDPVLFLTGVMKDPLADIKLRADAAKALLPYKYAKVGEGGKKEQRQGAAKTAAGGKFAATPAPPLRQRMN